MPSRRRGTGRPAFGGCPTQPSRGSTRMRTRRLVSRRRFASSRRNARGTRPARDAPRASISPNSPRGCRIPLCGQHPRAPRALSAAERRPLDRLDAQLALGAPAGRALGHRGAARSGRRSLIDARGPLRTPLAHPHLAAASGLPARRRWSRSPPRPGRGRAGRRRGRGGATPSVDDGGVSGSPEPSGPIDAGGSGARARSGGGAARRRGHG